MAGAHLRAFPASPLPFAGVWKTSPCGIDCTCVAKYPLRKALLRSGGMIPGEDMQLLVLDAIAAFAIVHGLAHHAGPPLPRGVRADRVVIEKHTRRLTLLRKGRVLKRYRVVLGPDPEGPKMRAGDGRTPEGTYRVDWRNRRSRSYLSLHISYPDRLDRERAKILAADPGGDIMIHGLPNGRGWLGRFYQMFYRTEGCIALTNGEMREIWRAVPDGTVVEIRP